MERYLIFINEKLRMLSEGSAEHDGLITYLLCELKKSPITFFQEFIHQKHVALQEGALTNITITSLIPYSTSPTPTAMTLAASLPITSAAHD
jgi:hypothetical protein